MLPSAADIALDLDPTLPHRIIREPAQFVLQVWMMGVGVTSHTAFIDDHPALLGTVRRRQVASAA